LQQDFLLSDKSLKIFKAMKQKGDWKKGGRLLGTGFFEPNPLI
jgi:hypothetical protein